MSTIQDGEGPQHSLGLPTSSVQMFTIREPNQEPPLMVITREQGTVGIKFDEAYLRTLALAKDEGKEAYSLLCEAMKSHGVSLEYFHTVLHHLLSSTINTFHQNAYAMAQANNPGAFMKPNEDQHVG